MRELYRSDYFILTVDDESRLVRRARTERPFPAFDEARVAYEAMLDVFEQIDQARHSLLVDVRLAPPRNDPAFEQFVSQYTARNYGHFRRAAVLVKTHAGRLQLVRMLRDIRGVEVFMDEQAAIAYLTA